MATQGSWAAVLFGFATLVAATCVVEWMLRVGILNRYIVPLPSEVILSFPRIVIEERILDRFLTTFMECFYAMPWWRWSAFAGVLPLPLHCVAGRHRDLLPPQRRPPSCWRILSSLSCGRSMATIVVIGFIAGLPPVILKTLEGLAGTRRVLVDVGRSLNLGASQMFAKILLPARRCRLRSSAPPRPIFA
jgi:ABC-type nitrate/sulfonate/bicarbonate transport system permease component